MRAIDGYGGDASAEYALRLLPLTFDGSRREDTIHPSSRSSRKGNRKGNRLANERLLAAMRSDVPKSCMLQRVFPCLVHVSYDPNMKPLTERPVSNAGG
jgi:hypothetical protein